MVKLEDVVNVFISKLVQDKQMESTAKLIKVILHQKRGKVSVKNKVSVVVTLRSVSNKEVDKYEGTVANIAGRSTVWLVLKITYRNAFVFK